MIKFHSQITLNNVRVEKAEEGGSPLGRDQMVALDSNITPQTTLKSQFSNTGRLGAMYNQTPQFMNVDMTVYKQSGFDDKLWQYLGHFQNAESFDDCNIATGVPVRYMVTTDANSSSAAVTPYYKPKFTKWILQDLVYDPDTEVYYTVGDIFSFNGNVEPGDITYNTNTVKYDSLGQYGRVYKSKLKYQSSSLACLFGGFSVLTDLNKCGYYVDGSKVDLEGVLSIDGISDKIEEVYNANSYRDYYCKIMFNGELIYFKSILQSGSSDNYVWSSAKLQVEMQNAHASYVYVEDKDKMQRWYDCLYNNNLKLLRDPAGNKWVVSITDQIGKNIAYNSGSYPTRISFSWQEVMDASKIRILNVNLRQGSEVNA